MSGATTKIGEPPQFPVITFKNVGNPERGLALKTKEVFRTIVSLPIHPDRIVESVGQETEVTELSTEPLDPALFEVPKNFRKVSEIRRAPVVPYWTRMRGWLDYYWVRLKRAI